MVPNILPGQLLYNGCFTMAFLKDSLRSSFKGALSSRLSVLPLFAIALLPVTLPVLSLFAHSPVVAQVSRDPLTGPSETASPATDLVTIPGTSLSLIPPAGFVLSEDYSGFFNADDFSSIVLAELPSEAYPELAAIFSSTPEAITAAFAARGLDVEVDSIATVEHEGKAVPFVSAVQIAGGLDVQKYFVLFGQEQAGLANTLLLTFNVMPDSLLGEGDVVTTIRSAEISPPPSIEETITELPFTFEVVEPFQRAYGLMGTAVLLNLSGELGADSEEPLIIIARSLNTTALETPQPAELAALSERLLRETDGFADTEITRQLSVEFAGRAGYLIEASQPDSDDFVAQYVSVMPDGYYLRMLVLGAPDKVAELMPAIQAIRSSVAIRSQG